MTTATIIPAAIDQLITTVTAALPSAQVVDGPGAYDMGEYPVVVYIGASDPDDEDFTNAASSEQTWAWLGHVQRRAELTVRCAIVGWNGDGDQRAARNAARDALQAFTDAITDDPSLSGAVIASTGISDLALEQSQDNHGAKAKFTFGLPMQAWLE